jgi:transposase InsO family protein
VKQKFEAFDVLKKFKSMVENESGQTIKILRSNKGGEYKLNEFIEFCDFHGIKRQFTARYTPQQNGVAERKNQTIMDMAQSMLKEKHLSNEYWGDEVLCSVFILNRSLTKTNAGASQAASKREDGRQMESTSAHFLKCFETLM